MAAALTTVALVAGCGSSGNEPQSSAPSHVPTSKAPRTVAVVGTITLTKYSGWTSQYTNPGSPCHALDGFGDIKPGAQVVISDDAARTLAIVALRAGKVASNGCAFGFHADVPAGKGFYGVTVSHRGTVKQSEADLGDVALTLR